MKKIVYTLAFLAMGLGAQAQKKQAVVNATTPKYNYTIQQQLEGLNDLDRLVKLDPAMYEALGQMMKARWTALSEASTPADRNKTLMVYSEKIKASLSNEQLNKLMQNQDIWHKISLQ